MMGIEWLKPAVFFGSMLYAVIGVGVFWISFVIVDKLTPYDLWEEIVEKKNVALAIVVGTAVVLMMLWLAVSWKLKPIGRHDAGGASAGH